MGFRLWLNKQRIASLLTLLWWPNGMFFGPCQTHKYDTAKDCNGGTVGPVGMV